MQTVKLTDGTEVRVQIRRALVSGGRIKNTWIRLNDKVILSMTCGNSLAGLWRKDEQECYYYVLGISLPCSRLPKSEVVVHLSTRVHYQTKEDQERLLRQAKWALSGK